MTIQFSNGQKEPEPLSTQFSNGQEILEPRPNRYDFNRPAYNRNRFHYYHVLKHVIAGYNKDWLSKKEKWDDLNLIPQNELQNIRDMDSVQQIINNHTRNNTWIDDKLTPAECKTLQDIPQFRRLAERYREMLSNILGECINHVKPECQIFNPHCHLLKTKDEINSNKFAQSIKLLDAQTGIFIVARASYIHDPNSKNPFRNKKKFVIKTGYRAWISKDVEDRTKKFDRSEKDLQLLKDKLSSLKNEKKHNPDFPVNLDIQNHIPKYIS